VMSFSASALHIDGPKYTSEVRAFRAMRLELATLRARPGRLTFRRDAAEQD
jgi:hypothetical protein